MEKITIVNINDKDYKLTESAYLLLSDYNSFIKRNISDKQEINDIEIQISVIIDMEIENKGEDVVIDKKIIEEVIAVLKENGKIFFNPKVHKSKQRSKQFREKKRRKPSNSDVKRDTENSVIGGVCAGFAKKYNTDPVWIRIIFILGGIFTAFSIFLIAYIILWIALPVEK